MQPPCYHLFQRRNDAHTRGSGSGKHKDFAELGIANAMIGGVFVEC